MSGHFGNLSRQIVNLLFNAIANLVAYKTLHSHVRTHSLSNLLNIFCHTDVAVFNKLLLQLAGFLQLFL